MSLEEFETINRQLIESQKALVERERILSIMGSIDEQLSLERSRLPKLVMKQKYEGYDVKELEGLTPKALFYTLLKRREEELEKEVEEYLEAKLAAEYCRLKIARLEAYQIELEHQLLLLADVDEEVKALQNVQVELVTQLQTQEGRRYREIVTKHANRTALYQDYSDAVKRGETIRGKIEAILEQLLDGRDYFGFLKYVREFPTGRIEKPVEAAIALALETQPELDYFQFRLKQLTNEYLGLSLQPPSLWVSLISPYYAPGDQTKIGNWFTHLQSVSEELEPEIEYMMQCRDQLESELVLLEKEKTELMRKLWHSDSFQ